MRAAFVIKSAATHAPRGVQVARRRAGCVLHLVASLKGVGSSVRTFDLAAAGIAFNWNLSFGVHAPRHLTPHSTLFHLSPKAPS